jgi:RimJ/RimL family protein N-acetyltransferase
MTQAGALDRVQTARLVCLRPAPEQAADLATVLRDPRVARTLFATGAPPNEADVVANLAAKEDHWSRHGFGLWMLYDRASGSVVGRGGLQHTIATGRDEIEAGWAIVPERWGEGLATELALASVHAAFETLGLAELIAYTLAGNLASRRVMEKAGFAYESELQYLGLPHVLYRRVRC